MVPVLYRFMPTFGAMYVVVVSFVGLVCHTVHHSFHRNFGGLDGNLPWANIFCPIVCRPTNPARSSVESWSVSLDGRLIQIQGFGDDVWGGGARKGTTPGRRASWVQGVSRYGR